MTPDDKRDLCHKYGYSDEYRDYWIAHPVCEACGTQPSTLPHHIRTRASGGQDTDSNLLALCFTCHGKWHNEGWQKFAEVHGSLCVKIEQAREARR